LKISKHTVYFDHSATIMLYSDKLRYSDENHEILAICHQNSREAVEAFIQRKRETDPDYSPPLPELLLGATD
jgi:hypothetical protein